MTKTLNAKKADFTKNLLLEAAIDLTRTMEISEVSFKNIAEQAGISERTMFRHFRTRDEFLDALAFRMYQDLNLPDIPNSIDNLLFYIEELYAKFEKQPRKVLVLLSADLFPRIISSSAKARFEALKRLLTEAYPNCTKPDIIKTAANLRYVMSASSWRYYRMNFEFDLETSIECASMMITQAIRYLEAKKTQ